MKNNTIQLFSIICVLVGLTAYSSLNAQQTPISNFNNFNNYLLNPAEAGHQYRLAGTASHRIQWQGIDGAPTTTFLGVHGAINDKMGIGGRVIVDQTDILKQFNAALSYSYRVKIDDNTDLRFGVSGMMVQNSIDFNNAVIGDYADEIATGGNQGGVTFDAEAGLMLSHKKAKLGIASSHLFESDVNYDLPDNRGDGTFQRVRNFSLYGSYLFKLSDSWDLEPFVLARNQGVESFQVEVHALASWKQTLFVGMGFRQEAGYIGKIGFQITDYIMAAYAYEFSNTGIASNSNGSHEFMLGLRLGKKEKMVVPSTETSKSDAENLKLVEEERIAEEKRKVEEQRLAEEQRVEENRQKLAEQKAALDLESKRLAKEDAVNSTHDLIVEEAQDLSNSKEEIISNEIEPIPSSINKEVFEEKLAFEFESVEISDDAKQILNLIAIELINHPDQKVLIKGHTCNMGNDRINRKVSNQRAAVIKNYLIGKNVKESQIKVKGMLDSEPLVPNSSLENRKKNRRAEFELMVD